MSGWCAANCVSGVTPRERFFCMAAASVADVDGLSYLFGPDAYMDYHHVLGHNLALAVLASAVFAAFASPRHRLLTFVLCLALAHLHLVLDYFGSGPNWRIYYLWPFSRWSVKNPDAWEFFSWQNITVAMTLLAWTLVIAVSLGRTPVELITPDLDRRFVAWLRRRVRVGAPQA
jgi:inner membrane protein